MGQHLERYVKSMWTHGSESVVVVFDGYVSGPNTKDATHLRCTKRIMDSNSIRVFEIRRTYRI